MNKTLLNDHIHFILVFFKDISRKNSASFSDIYEACEEECWPFLGEYIAFALVRLIQDGTVEIDSDGKYFLVS